MKTAAFLAAMVLVSFLSAVPASSSSLNDIASMEFPAGPQLLSPVTDDIKLSGKDFLEFKWRFPDPLDTDYFYLRIYRGYETYVKDMIFRQRYSASELPPRLPASFFQAGSTYTWVLVQIYKDGRRSEPVSSSFKIIK